MSRIDPDTLFERKELLGRGNFGSVYRGVDRRQGHTVAVKVIDFETAQDEVEEIALEVQFLSQISQPNFTRYFGSYIRGSELWIIMEYCSGGSCLDMLKVLGTLSEEHVAVIMRDVLRGLQYLHGEGKLHRDIKAANILLTRDGTAKLADFGVSAQLSATLDKKITFCGTPFWMAPEVIRQSGHDEKADIWSLGITAIELALGAPPHAEKHPMKVLFLIPKQPPPRLPSNYSSAFQDFVAQCLVRDPRRRPTAAQLLKHKFITRVRRTTSLVDMVQSVSAWRASNKSSSRDARYHRRPQHVPSQKDFASFETLKAHEPPGDRDLWDFGTIVKGARGAPDMPDELDLDDNLTPELQRYLQTTDSVSSVVTDDADNGGSLHNTTLMPQSERLLSALHQVGREGDMRAVRAAESLVRAVKTSETDCPGLVEQALRSMN